jgi:TonB family protein
MMRCLLILLALTLLAFSAGAAPSKQDAKLEKTARAVAISAPYPDYPYAARRARITGRCLVEMHVDSPTGVVTDAVMAESSGHAILDNAALSACRRWRFKPGTVARVRLPITFAMPVTIDPTRWYRFSGIVRAVNVRAGTITVTGPTGMDTIVVSAKTRLEKNGRRITMENIAVTDTVHGRAYVRAPTFAAVAESLSLKSASP